MQGLHPLAYAILFLLHNIMKKNSDAIYISTRPPRRVHKARKARSIPYKGQPIVAYEHEKLARCWYCGVINTTGRTEEDTGDSVMASTLQDQTVQSRGYHTSGKDRLKATIAVNRSGSFYHAAPAAGQTGAAKTVKVRSKPVAHTGCRGCGTINWLGKY